MHPPPPQPPPPSQSNNARSGLRTCQHHQNCWTNVPNRSRLYPSKFTRPNVFLVMFHASHVLLRLIHWQSNPNPITGNPVPDSGAGHLVQPGDQGFGLHDHGQTGRVPKDDKAFLTYTFASPVRVTKAVVVQHTNGADEVELFSGSKSCGRSQGKSRTNGQITGPAVSLTEHMLYDYTFSENCPAGTGISSPITPCMSPQIRLQSSSFKSAPSATLAATHCTACTLWLNVLLFVRTSATGMKKCTGIMVSLISLIR
jgi:hypothetical protein